MFDIALLGSRLRQATEWVMDQKRTLRLRIGHFGASTGAAAALIAAADRPGIGAIVSRDGRPDLAGDVLERVTAPTLLIVGAADDVVIELNREAYARLRCEKRLNLVPRATHLFEEPGTLDRVVNLTNFWFVKYLTTPAGGKRRGNVH